MRVCITGITGGLGTEIGKKFKSEGAYVIGVSSGQKLIANDFCDDHQLFDLSIDNKIDQCADMIRKSRIDVLVNAAGINKNASFEESDPEVFKRVWKINTYAPYILIRAALPYMRTMKWGRVINVSSIWGLVGREGRGSYSSSKFALDGLTVAISAEYSKHNILCNSVSPGFFNTELTKANVTENEKSKLQRMVPMGRFGEPSELPSLIYWLSSHENTYLTGQNIAIDGGYTRV